MPRVGPPSLLCLGLLLLLLSVCTSASASCTIRPIMIEAVAAAAATATSSDSLSMLSISSTMSMSGVVSVVWGSRVWLCMGCVTRENNFKFFAGPRSGNISAVQLSPTTFATPKVCKRLLRVAQLLSTLKVCKLFAQRFAPIKSVHQESCDIGLQTFTFFATFCSHKERC